MSLNPQYPVALLLTTWFLLFSLSPVSASELDEQRDNYRKATDALAKDDKRTYRVLARELKNYPLYPYLLYAEYSIDPGRVPEADIKDFLDRYADSALAPRLRSKWLSRLKTQGKDQAFIRHFSDAVSSTELKCHDRFLRYRLQRSPEIIADAIELWQAGKSQPKACDPLFSALKEDGHITNKIAWVRYTRAVLNHEYRLAKYIAGFFSDDHHTELARTFLAIDRSPTTVGQYDLLDKHEPEMLAVISHGLIHLARLNGSLALKHWGRYHQTHEFLPAQEEDIISALVKGLMNQGHTSAADTLLENHLATLSEVLLDWRLREALKSNDWAVIKHLSEQLSIRREPSERWQYWRFRALQATKTNPEERTELLRRLSTSRSFYGFLASEALAAPYSFQHEPVTISDEAIAALADRMPFQRIRELLHHGDIIDARREWYFTLSGADQTEWITAANLATRWQWHQSAILSMARAEYWNDIELRFPLAYLDEFQKNAHKTGIPLHLLIALSRQESAFAPDVVSPAGARGLMQLMPATAKQTAQRHGVSYHGVSELASPATNITLGSRYYAEMLKRFDQNRILATAAYNAGPRRVDNWLSNSGGKLPFDAWIETIPFTETRNYVQNVLAFSAIYAHHLKTPAKMLDKKERQRKL